jgi:serine/threonine protein kinase
LLGRGDVGRVYLVKMKETETLFAMKVLKKADMIQRNKVKRVLTEREILATAKHPFIVTLYYSFQSTNRIYFIMDYCAGGEFYRTIQRQPHKCLTEDQARFYAAEVLSSLEYLHLMGFIYRDLKPENILLHSSGHIMLTDFDLSKTSATPVTVRIKKGGPQSAPTVVAEPDLVTNSFVGTEEYLAPEVIRGKGHSAAVDWWTFGILIFEMLYGTTPFRGVTREETFENIARNELKFPEHPRCAVTRDCKNLIKKLLHPDPKKRLGSEGGAAEVKSHPFFKSINWALIRNLKPPIIPHLEGPLDTSHFRKLVDDMVKEEEETEVDSSELSEDHPFKSFKRVQRDQESEKDSAKEHKDNKDHKDHRELDSLTSLTSTTNSIPAMSLSTSTSQLKVMEKGNVISVSNGNSTKDSDHKTPRYMMVSSAPLDEKEDKRKTTDSPKINRRDRSLSAKLDKEKDRRDSNDKHHDKDKDKHDKHDKHDKKHHHRDSDSESSEGKKDKKKHHRTESAKSSLRNGKAVKEELEKHDEQVTSPLLVQQVNLSATTPNTIHSPRTHKHKHRSSERPHHSHHHDHEPHSLAATTDLDTRHRKKSSGSDSGEEARSPDRKHKHHHKDKKDNKDKRDHKEHKSESKDHNDVVITVVAPKDDLSASEKRKKDNKDSGGHSTKSAHNSDDEDHESKSERDKKRAKDNKHDDEKDKHHRDKSKRHTVMSASLDVKKDEERKEKHRSLHESDLILDHEDSHKEKDKHHHKDKNNKDKSDHSDKLSASNSNITNNSSNKSS